MAKSNLNGIDMLIAETPVPDHMKKLKRIGVEDLVVGAHYLRFDGSLIRRIDAIEGHKVHCQDGLGVMVFDVETFLKLHTALAPPGSKVEPDDDDSFMASLPRQSAVVESVQACSQRDAPVRIGTGLRTSASGED